MLSFAEGDSPFGEIVGRELNSYAVSGHDANKMLPHFAGHVGDYELTLIQLYAKSRIGECLRHHAFYFESFFFLLLRHRRLS